MQKTTLMLRAHLVIFRMSFPDSLFAFLHPNLRYWDQNTVTFDFTGLSRVEKGLDQWASIHFAPSQWQLDEHPELDPP